MDKIIELDINSFVKSINDKRFNWFILFYIDGCVESTNAKEKLIKLIDIEKFILENVKFGMINGTNCTFDAVTYFPMFRFYTINNTSIIYPYQDIELNILNNFINYNSMPVYKNDIYILNDKNEETNSISVSHENITMFQSIYSFIWINVNLIYDFMNRIKI